MNRFIIALGCAMCALGDVFAQDFYFGNDLSYVNQMEDCGATFKENGQAKDVYEIFANHGCNLVRVRLWVNPSWQNSLVQPSGVKNQYNDFADVVETISRAKGAGMQVMLDIHYSDFWADPTHQIIPSTWATSISALQDSAYKYTYRTLNSLNDLGLLPEVVKVGNENNLGILCQSGMDASYSATTTISSYDLAYCAKLYKQAFKAIRQISTNTGKDIKIALHYSGLDCAWWYTKLIANGATDFDIIGFSYYYAWHGASIDSLGSTIASLKKQFPSYDVMVAETGYLWSTDNIDNLSNIITTPDPNYLPVSRANQLEYMTDFTREVILSGGVGVIFWEPAWVSTLCRTPWGQGTSHDHVVFFDYPDYNWVDEGGGSWTESKYYTDILDFTTTQTIALAAGWNLISLNISPADLSIKSTFSSVLSNISEIKTADGFWKNGQNSNFNSLTSVSSGAAYLVYMNAADTLVASGLPSTATTLSIATGGWSLAGVPIQTPTSISPLVSNTSASLVKDFDGFWNLSSTPSITTFKPGKGYFIKTTGATTISWPD